MKLFSGYLYSWNFALLELILHKNHVFIYLQKLQNVLKEAWDAEGSPFKGQPFDPTLVNVQNAENL